jgi:hypothetical protein
MAHTVKLRTDAFGKAMRLAGFRSDYGLAKAMGVNRSTIARAVSGELRPGPVFIASALTVLAPMQFQDLFEIVPVADAPPDDGEDRACAPSPSP